MESGDFIHTEDLIDAMLVQIADNAPASWTTAGHPEALKALAFGDFVDYALRGENLLDECPAVLVRGMTVAPEATRHGAGGVFGTRERLRVVMARPFDATYDDDGVRCNVARGKARYGKILNTAVFADHRLGQADNVVTLSFAGLDYGESGDAAIIGGLGQRLWAIHIDVDIICRTGGATGA